MRENPILAKRHRQGKAALAVFLALLVFAILSLGVLLFSIVERTAGYVLSAYTIDPATLLNEGEKLETLTAERASVLLEENLSRRRLRALTEEKALRERPQEELIGILETEILELTVLKTWSLLPSLFAKEALAREAEQLATEANAEATVLEFRYWLNPRFLTKGQSGDPMLTGIRTAIFGSLLTILLTLAIAFPLGIGAAIWLEEYAADTRLTRIIQTNIYNLAGVPSIIYGMLGLAVFVRGLGDLTSGAIFGIAEEGSGGRTILSAALTLAILILPILIINAQEAIRAVPNSLREAAYALGATRWKTIAAHVLPASMDRVLTGTLIAISRALGETAPLVVVGAATYITADPKSIFSRFTTLPIQIYQWTARPQAEFRNTAAAAIVALLALLLALNAGAIILRDRFRSAKR